MVIRTEYRGQRYSMASSDPLPAGFEIRFGSLNFQATGNGYLMRITNRDELRARRPTGLSYGPPWAHHLGGCQDRLLGGPLGLPGLRYTAPEGVEHKDYTRVVLG
jgi:hypothetical protein